MLHFYSKSILCYFMIQNNYLYSTCTKKKKEKKKGKRGILTKCIESIQNVESLALISYSVLRSPGT